MAYSDNPFNSPQGQALMKNILNLMFIEPEGKPSQIEQRDKGRQINHYRGNIVNIVNKMRKFVKGYQQVIISETASSVLSSKTPYKRGATENLFLTPFT